MEPLTTVIIALITAIGGPWMVNWSKKKYSSVKALPPEDEIKYSEQIDEQMYLLSEDLGCDKIFIAQFHNGGFYYPTGKSIRKFSIFFETKNTNIPTFQHILQNVPTSLFAKTFSQISKGIEISINEFDKGDHYDLIHFKEEYNVGSLYMTSINDLHNRCIGVICITYHNRQHTLSEDDWKMVRQKTNNIGAILNNFLDKNK